MQAGVPDVRRVPLSGPANHVKHVFDELKNLGHEVTLLAYFDKQIWKSGNLQDFEPVSVQWLDHGPLRLLESAVRRVQSALNLPYAAFFESLRFAVACRQELAGYDVFYERMGWFGYGGAWAAQWLDIPHFFEVNGDHLREYKMLGIAPQGMQRWISVWLMQRAINWSSHVVAAGNGWRDSFVERWGIEPANISVVENGSEVVDLLTRNELRSFCTDPDSVRPVAVVFLGAFDPWHGLTILLNAVAKARKRGLPLHLTMIGSGMQEESIRQQIEELEMKDVTTLTGTLSPAQFAPILAQADIAASPYCGRTNFSGLKLLDYKSAGLAIVASGANGQPDMVRHGKTGWIVPPCDEEALYEAIVALASDATLRRTMGQEARREAEKYHSWRHTVQQLEGLLAKVTAK